MADDFVLEERPETSVYHTANGFVGIRQILRGEESVILLTPDEALAICAHLRQAADQVRAGARG